MSPQAVRGTVVLALLLVGCNGGGSQRAKLELGAVLSTTGDLATVGTEELQALTLAMDEINAAGGVLGKDLTVVNKDDGTDDVKGEAAAHALVDLGVPIVFGAVASDVTLKVSAVLAP